MVLYMVAELWCDDCGMTVQTDDLATSREHRRQMREQGWVRRRHPNSGLLIDLCPGCADRPHNMRHNDGRPEDGAK